MSRSNFHFENRNYQIDDIEAREIIELFKNEFVQAAVGVIQTNLFLYGLEVESLDKKTEINPMFNEIIKNDWGEYARAALNDFIMFGYTVVYPLDQQYVSKKKFEMTNPTHIDRRLYSIKITMKKNFTHEYKIVLSGRTFQENGDKKARIYFMPGYKPDFITGKHNSIIAILKHRINDMKRLLLVNTIANEKRLKPETFYEEEQGVKTSSTEDMVSKIHFDIQSNKFVEQEPDLTKWSRFRNDFFDQHPEAKRRKVAEEAYTVTPTYVPSGYKLANPSGLKVEVPIDILPSNDALRDLIFALFQLPVTLLFAQLSSKLGTSSHIDLDNSESEKLNRVLSLYDDAIIKLVTDIYIDFENAEEMEFQFVLNILSPVGVSQAIMLEDLDYITTKDAKKLALRALGLGKRYYFEGKNVHDRIRPGGNENFLDSMVSARVQNIEAETKLHLAKARGENVEATAIQKEGLHPPKAPSSS